MSERSRARSLRYVSWRRLYDRKHNGKIMHRRKYRAYRHLLRLVAPVSEVCGR